VDPLHEALTSLNSGGIIIYPTETVFGIGCGLNFPKSIERLYQIKQREAGKPTSVVFPDFETAKTYVEFSDPALKLAEKFWPGPLTLCLPTIKEVPEMLLGPNRTLGVRVPSHQWLLNLLTLFRQPLLAPSANFHGEKPPSHFAEIDKHLASLVDYVVTIDPTGKEPSTVVSFTEGKLDVIREGEITRKMIEETIS